MSIGYYKTILAYGIKLMTTLLLAGIGLSILQGIQAQAGQGWGSDIMNLGVALITSAILLGIIGKAPGVVAGITGVSTNGAGGHGWASFLAGAGLAAALEAERALQRCRAANSLARRSAMPSNKAKRSREGDRDSKLIAFGIRAVGCLYVGYWAIFFGIAAFLIITSYLREHKHHPAGKPACA